MNKLQMAHDYAMLHMMNPQYKDVDDLEMVQWAHDYADAMLAEDEKRNYLEKQDSSEWQPDWSQAPDWASYWSYDRAGSFWWENKPRQQSYYWMVDCGKTLSSDNFNYAGDWYWSLRKRPQ